MIFVLLQDYFELRVCLRLLHGQATFNTPLKMITELSFLPSTSDRFHSCSATKDALIPTRCNVSVTFQTGKPIGQRLWNFSPFGLALLKWRTSTDSCTCALRQKTNKQMKKKMKPVKKKNAMILPKISLKLFQFFFSGVKPVFFHPSCPEWL